MQAVFVRRFGPPEDLAVREVAAPAPAPHEVLVEVHAIGVNFPDLMVSAGTYQVLHALPFIPGKEAAGIVRATGAGVTAFRPGQRVAFEIEAGTYAELVSVDAGRCFHVPDAVSMIDAAAGVLAYQTSYFALTERGQLKPGEWVLVNGAGGGVGIAAVQIAHALEGRVIAGLGTPSKADFVRARGAQAVVDLGAPDLKKSLLAQVQRITGGRGVDVIVDPIGGEAFDAGMGALAEGGRMLIAGFTSGTIPQMRANYILMKHVSVIGARWGIYRDKERPRVMQAQEWIFERFASGAFKSPVSALYPLERAAQALRAMADRKALGKIVLTTRHAQTDRKDPRHVAA